MNKSRSFIEIIYIDSEDLARKTNLCRECSTDAETLAEFRSYRIYEVDIKQAAFLLDYHNRKGDMNSTIPIDARGFIAITGQHPKSDAAYCKIDRDYWREVQKDRKAA